MMASAMPANGAVAPTTGAAERLNLAEARVVRGDLVLASSRAIASTFGKRHDNILRLAQQTISELEAIEAEEGYPGTSFNRLKIEAVDQAANGAPVGRLDCEPTSYSEGPSGRARPGMRRSGRMVFIATTYRDEKGEKRPMFLFNRPAFTLIAMSLTGRDALRFKAAYIDAFERMEEVLRRRRNAEWQLQPAEGRVARTDLTDAVQRLEAYARAHGSTHAGWFYVQYTKLLYRGLFICLDLPPGALRDALDRRQLSKLRMGETMVADLIDELIAAGVHCKSIYDQVKQRVRAYADVVGRSTVLAPPQPQLAVAADRARRKQLRRLAAVHAERPTALVAEPPAALPVEEVR